MSQSDLTSPGDCIFHLLAKASRTGVRYWKSAVSDLGLTAVQAKVLSFLHIYGEVTASHLGTLVALDNATLTGVLDRLEASQYVERHVHPDDRRAILIRLTTEGAQLAKQVHARVVPANQDFLSGFSEAETAMLKALLKRL